MHIDINQYIHENIDRVAHDLIARAFHATGRMTWHDSGVLDTGQARLWGMRFGIKPMRKMGIYERCPVIAEANVDVRVWLISAYGFS